MALGRENDAKAAYAEAKNSTLVWPGGEDIITIISGTQCSIGYLSEDEQRHNLPFGGHTSNRGKAS